MHVVSQQQQSAARRMLSSNYQTGRSPAEERVCRERMSGCHSHSHSVCMYLCGTTPGFAVPAIDD